MAGGRNQRTLTDIENALRKGWLQIAHSLEVVFYVALGILLSTGAAVTLAANFSTVWKAIREGTLGSDSFVVLEQLLRANVCATSACDHDAGGKAVSNGAPKDRTCSRRR